MVGVCFASAGRNVSMYEFCVYFFVKGGLNVVNSLYIYLGMRMSRLICRDG